MKTLLAALVLGLSVSTAALAEPFTKGSHQHPAAVRSSAAVGSMPLTAELGGFNERGADHRHDGSTAPKTPRAEMTSAATPTHRPQGWTDADAWNS